MKITFAAFLLSVITLSNSIVLSQTQGSIQIVSSDLSALFEKMKNARNIESYRGQIKIERRFGNNTREFNKSVFANPVLRVFREKLEFNPEEMQRMRQMREERGRGESRMRPRRMIRYWNPNFQRDIRSEANFADLTIHLELVQENYVINRGAGEAIAGKSTEYIEIIPKYEYRPGNRLWIDEETGLILKREIFDPENPDTPFYKEEFITIEYIGPDETPPDFDQDDRPAGRGAAIQGQIPGRGRNLQRRVYFKKEDIPSRYRSRIHYPTDLPPGFALDKILITRERRNTSYHQVYTDGLILFSLFQMRGDHAERFGTLNRRRGSRGGGWRFPPGGTTLYKKIGRLNYIIVGYARSELLQPVLDSIGG